MKLRKGEKAVLEWHPLTGSGSAKVPRRERVETERTMVHAAWAPHTPLHTTSLFRYGTG